MPKLLPQTEKLRATRIVKSLNAHAGNASAVARELGVTPQAIAQARKRPSVQKALQDIIDSNLNKAGASLRKTYTRLAEGLEATKVINPTGLTPYYDTDFKERRESVKLCLQLRGHLKDDTGPGPGGMNLIQIFLPEPVPLKEVIDVEATT